MAPVRHEYSNLGCVLRRKNSRWDEGGMVYICSCIHDSKVLEDVTSASIVSRVGPNVA